MKLRYAVQLIVVVCVFATLAHAQNSWLSGVALGINPNLPPNFGGTPGPVYLSYAPVRVCNLPLTQTQPCLPLATVTDLFGNPLSVAGPANFGQLTTNVVGGYQFGCQPGQNIQIQVAPANSATPSLSFVATCPAGAGPFTISLNGTNAWTGTNAFSGPSTFSGPIVCTALNTTACISPSNPQGWAGTDVVGWLTSALSCISAGTGCPAAFAGSTNGGRIEIAAGTYLTSGVGASTITYTKAVDIVGDGWTTNIQLASGVGSTPLLRFGTSGFCGGSIRNIQFSTQSGTPGTYALEFDPTVAGNKAFCKFLIDNIQIGPGFGTNAIWLNNTVGEADGGWFDSTIQNSYIFGGIIGTAIGDSNVIDKSLITDVNGGAKQSIGVDVSFTPGSSSFRLSNGTINTQGAGLHVGAAATYLHVNGMEFETPNSSVACSNGAYVDIDGTVGNPANGVDFINNGFQIVNSSTCNDLRINFAANTSVLEKNDWSVTNKGIVTTANATTTRISRQNCNGTTIANFLSDGASAGQTLYTFGGQNVCSNALVYRDNTGTTTYSGVGANPALVVVSGAATLYDGGANAAAIASSGPSATATPSGIKTGFVAVGGTPAGLTGTGACATANITTQLGGAWAGKFTCTGTTGASTIVIVPGVTAQHGWSCWANDETSGNAVRESADGTTSCTIAGTVNANDVLTFGAVPY